MNALGIDIGGSTVKSGVVDLRTGRVAGDRNIVATPNPSDPTSVAEVVAALVHRSGWAGPVGVTLPCVVVDGITRSAANIAPSWMNVNAREVFQQALGSEHVAVVNDADAAGIAEHRFGISAQGLTVVLTFGTGIGSAMLFDGVLHPNSELGHLKIGGISAERIAAASVKRKQGLSYEVWSERVSLVLRNIEDLIAPDLFVLGGEISKFAQDWVPLLTLRTPVVAARLLNSAGLVGAALEADRVFGLGANALSTSHPGP